MKTKDLILKMNFKILPVTFVIVLLIGFASCTQTGSDSQRNTSVETIAAPEITEQEVLNVQQAWGEGIVKIGKAFTDNGDYKQAATEHINEFYNYQEGSVLFKPTLASEKQFRTDFEGALSYFVGGNEAYSEDKGFAIKPWSAVRWENIGTKIIGNMAVAMGNYYFTPAEGGDDVKVEYSFAYTKNENGELKIILHDSHVPFQP
jgi:hypothetical protein